MGGRAQRCSEHEYVFTQIKEIKYSKSVSRNDLKILATLKLVIQSFADQSVCLLKGNMLFHGSKDWEL